MLARRLKPWRRAILVILGAALIAACTRLVEPPSASLAKVGTLADFPPGSVARIQLKTTFLDLNPRIHAVTTPSSGGIILGVTPMPPQIVTPVIFLVNDSELGLLALYARDPHRFGCSVIWMESTQRFEDPCGGSKYTRTGEYIDGPAPRGLDRFGVVVTANGEVLVNVTDYQQGPHWPASR